MPIPLWVGRLNRIGLNRVTGRFAGRLPGFGIVLHRGRRSGRTFRTPVNVFSTDDGLVIALTYGRDAQWVKNVLAAGGCEVLTRGHSLTCTDPRLYRDESRRDVPAVVRLVLGRVNASDFLALRTSGDR